VMRSCCNILLTRCQKSCRCTRTASAGIMTIWSRRLPDSEDFGNEDKPGMTWRALRAEQGNEILERASVYYNDDLLMDEVVQAIQDFKGGRAGGERGDGWRGGGGGGRDAAAANRYTRTGETTAASIEALVIDSSAPLGHRTNPIGPDPSVPMKRQFYSTTRTYFGCNRFGQTRTAPDGS
jgi:hypothetical protein